MNDPANGRERRLGKPSGLLCGQVSLRCGCANFSVLAHTPGGRCDGVWFLVLALA
jgi:hypothetical protein